MAVKRESTNRLIFPEVGMTRNMTAIVTGAAGFIGSTLVDRLLAQGFQVIGVDNFSTGQRRFLKEALLNENFIFFEVDILNLHRLKEVFLGGDIVFHFAANAVYNKIQSLHITCLRQCVFKILTKLPFLLLALYMEKPL